MAQLASGLVGAALGGLVGGPLGARIGFTVGSVAGGYLFAPDAPDVTGPRRHDTGVMRGDEGAPLPIPYGAKRYPGVVIWEDPGGLKEIATKTSSGGGGKGGGGGGGSQTTFTYTWTCAIAFTEGDVTGIRRIWSNKKLIYDARETADAEAILATADRISGITIYTGDELQVADPLMESFEGVGNVPAYRGTCYIVLDEIDANNGRANIEAEVVRGAVIDPPIRITDFSPMMDTDGLEYSNGLFRVVSFEQDVPDTSHSTQTITTYDLNGNVVDTDKYIGNNISTNSSTYGIDNLPEIMHQTKDAAGDAAGTNTWWVRDFGGGSGLAIPAGPRAYSPDGFLTGGSLRYHTFPVGNGSAIFFNGYVFAENHHLDNEWGIARYPPGPSGVGRIPDSTPDRFKSMDALGSSFGGGSVSRLRLSAGDDGFLYLTRQEGGAFDDGNHVIVLDNDLNIVKSFELESGIVGEANLAIHNDRLAYSFANDFETDGLVRLYDISDVTLAANSNEAQIVGTASHDAPVGSLALTGIGGGLFVMDDGIWSMHEQIQLSAPTLESVVEDLCDQAGLSVGQRDGSDLTQAVHGYSVDRPMSSASAIDGLYPAFFFDTFESDGAIKFTKRGGASVVTIPIDDIGAYTGSPPVAALTRIRQQELELPEEFDFRYTDRNQDYEVGAQRARRIITTSTNALTTDSAVSMSSQEAARVADIFLQTAWAERVRYSFTLTQKYDYLNPADLVTIPIATGDLLVRIVSITRGANNVLEVDAVADLSTLYSSVEVGNDADNEDEQTLGIRGPTKLHIIDIALLQASDDGPGYYLAGAGYYTGWSGAAITRDDSGVELPVGAITTASVIGSTTDALEDYALNGRDVTSRTNVVPIGGGTLASVTDAQFLAGANAAVIGNEIVFFRDVTAESDGSFTLRHFLRGRGGTAQTGHGETDRFVFLDATALISVDGLLADTGADADFLAVSIGSASVEPSTQTVTLANGRIKPNAPAHAFAHQGASGDYNGAFVRTARKYTGWVDAVDVPLDETTEDYEIDVLDESGAVLRSITGIGSEAIFTYAIADIITDFGSPRSAIDFSAYQISDRVGRGKAASFTGGTPNFIESAYEVEVLSDSPILYWPMGRSLEELIVDSPLDAQAGTEGTHYEFNASSPAAAGYGSAKYLTGTFRLGSSNYTLLETLDDVVSIEFFTKASQVNTPGGALSLIIRGPLWGVYFPTNNRSNIAFRCEPDGAPTQEVLTTVAASVNNDAWHHVVCVWDNPSSGGTNKQFIYIDGAEAASRNISASAGVGLETSPTQDSEIFSNVSAGQQFEGSMAHAALYDSALSATQVLDHYNASGL